MTAVTNQWSDTGRSQSAQALAWVRSDDARGAARSVLGQRGLPATDDAIDEALDHALHNFVRHIARHGPLVATASQEEPNVAGYCRTILRNIATDLARGPKNLSLDEMLDETRDADNRDTRHLVPVVAEEPVEAVHQRAAVRTYRLCLASEATGEAPWVFSAGLAVVSIETDPHVKIAESIPAPQGRGHQDRSFWAGLHYAGRSDLLPTEAGSDAAAKRKARSRAINKVRSVLSRCSPQLLEGAEA